MRSLSSSRSAVRAALALLAMGALACTKTARDEGPAFRARAAPLRPRGCVELSQQAGLAEKLKAGREGESFCLAPGLYSGPLTLAPGVTLYGPPGAVIRSTGEGTTLLLASRTRLLGLTVDGSGSRFDVLDAAIKLDQGEDVLIEGVTIDHALFGILLNQSKRVQVLGNHVRGVGGPALGLRGDGIHLWETYDSLVEANLVENTRDVVVWYSSRNVLRGNEVRGGRYGTHFMYSHHNRLEGSRYLGNEVGVFVMYSRDLEVLGNTILDSSGAAGMGLGVKESGNIVARKNLFVRKTTTIGPRESPFRLNPACPPDLLAEFVKGWDRIFDIKPGRPTQITVDLLRASDVVDTMASPNPSDIPPRFWSISNSTYIRTRRSRHVSNVTVEP